MKKGGVGGGNTKTGAVYETKTDLKTFLNTLNGYHVDDDYQGGVFKWIHCLFLLK